MTTSTLPSRRLNLTSFLRVLTAEHIFSINPHLEVVSSRVWMSFPKFEGWFKRSNPFGGGAREIDTKAFLD
jgi:hypothetical protein